MSWLLWQNFKLLFSIIIFSFRNKSFQWLIYPYSQSLFFYSINLAHYLQSERICIRNIYLMGGVVKALTFKCGQETLQGDDPPSFFHFKIKDIKGKLIDFSEYKGKKAILVVNVACKWGLTSSNYKKMTAMHEELAEKGFEILAFPCNQFFKQESGSH